MGTGMEDGNGGWDVVVNQGTKTKTGVELTAVPETQRTPVTNLQNKRRTTSTMSRTNQHPTT